MVQKVVQTVENFYPEEFREIFGAGENACKTPKIQCLLQAQNVHM
jgi:hypothetical protein